MGDGGTTSGSSVIVIVKPRGSDLEMERESTLVGLHGVAMYESLNGLSEKALGP